MLISITGIPVPTLLLRSNTPGANASNLSIIFSVSTSGLNTGDYVTSTATDASGNMSEFGLNYLVTTTRAPLVADTFSRTTTTGWGAAETGGAYTTSGPSADLSVNGGVGNIKVLAGHSRGALAQNVMALDTDHIFGVQTDKVTHGGWAWSTRNISVI